MSLILWKSLGNALLLGVFSISAFASPYAWTLSGVTFADGGTGTGSFVYDAAIDQYFSVNLATTAGGARSSAAYGFLAPGVTSTMFGFVAVASNGNLTGTPGFGLFFEALVPAPTHLISPGSHEADCGDATCTFPTGVSRSVISGILIGTPVEVATPEPSSGLMLALGVTILAIARRRLLPGLNLLSPSSFPYSRPSAWQ
jgi:hypothetical protein